MYSLQTHKWLQIDDVDLEIALENKKEEIIKKKEHLSANQSRKGSSTTKNLIDEEIKEMDFAKIASSRAHLAPS